MTTQRGNPISVRERFTVKIEKVAHGGHFIARHAGQVFFVRHAIPDEVVEVEVTASGSSFVRADAIRIIEPSPDRANPPCKYSMPGGCGGCDFQHITLERQRLLKADVIREQFSRLAKMDIDVVVEEISAGLHWRTRVSSATSSQGKLGFYASRTHDVVQVDDCLIAVEEMKFQELSIRKWPVNSRVEISSPTSGETSIAIASAERGSKPRMTQGPAVTIEIINGLSLEVSQQSFWQSHRLAPQTLIAAIVESIREGDRVFDLYGGVGLFSAAILDRIGVNGSIDLVESASTSVADARRNFSTFPNVRIHAGDVAKVLNSLHETDVVLLDPPREGAGRAILENITKKRPRAIVYVACDPASLARDVSYLLEMGFELKELRAFDLFPMTHHVECVARFEPSQKRKNKVS